MAFPVALPDAGSTPAASTNLGSSRLGPSFSALFFQTFGPALVISQTPPGKTLHQRTRTKTRTLQRLSLTFRGFAFVAVKASPFFWRA